MPAKNKPLTQKTSVPESSVNRVQKRTHSQSCTNENRSQKKFEIDDEEAEIKQQCLSKNAVLKLSEDLQLSSFKSIDTKSKMNSGTFVIADATLFAPGERQGSFQDSFEMILLDRDLLPLKMWAHRSHSLPFAVLTVGQVIELNNFFCKSDDYVKFIGSPVNFRLEVNEDTTFTTNEALSAFWKNRFAVLTATQMNSTTFLTYHGLVCSLKLKSLRYPGTVTIKADQSKTYIGNYIFVTSDNKTVQLSLFGEQISRFQPLKCGLTYQILHSHVKSIEKTEYADFSLSAASPKLDFISTSPSEPERLLTILEICDISNSQFTYYSKLYFVSKIRVPAYKKVNDFCTYEAIVTDGSVTSDGRLRCSCVEIIGKRENVAWKPLKSIEGYFHMFYDGLLIKFRTMSNMIKTSTSEELPDEQLDREQAFVRM